MRRNTKQSELRNANTRVRSIHKCRGSFVTAKQTDDRDIYKRRQTKDDKL